jgi:bis(5'-nucleosyl)-tetraphosphatase (symmetrical)
MATYGIGDVQGCFTTLLTLLDKIGFDQTSDKLWFAGDLVNRGSQSLEVLRFVRELGDRAITVLGNHDLHLLAVAEGCAVYKSKDTFHDVLAAPDREALLAWLRHQPLLYHDASIGVTLVHAGLPPQWPLNVAQTHADEVQRILRGPSYRTLLEQFEANTSSTWKTGDDWAQRGYVVNAFTRLRYCDQEGRLALEEKGPPGSQSAPYLPWFAIPKRAHTDLNIVFGHWSTLGPCDAPGVYPLDTGCVWGGSLTALCLETKERHSVACVE